MAEDNGSGPRRIAVVNDLAGLHRAIREWVSELNVARATIDHIGGLPDGHASKLLAPTPLKHFGHVSLGLMLGACGLELWVVVADAKLRVLADRLTPKRAPLHTGGENVVVEFKLSLKHMRHLSQLAAVARKQIPPWKRRQIARRAARMRWRRQHNQA